MSEHPFEIVNPAALNRNASAAAGECGEEDQGSCDQRSDAPVCTNGNEDVLCTGERYRGCEVGQTDCANTPGGNEDDICCWGWGPGSGDNIDHGACIRDDARWGGIDREGDCIFWDEPPLF